MTRLFIALSALLHLTCALGAETCEDKLDTSSSAVKKLESPLFTRSSFEFPWWILKHEDDTIEDTLDGRIDASDLLRTEITSDCVTGHQGEHTMQFASAEALEHGLRITVHGGLPAYTGHLEILWRPGGQFSCAFRAEYPDQTNPLRWRITQKNLTILDNGGRVGQRLFAYLSVSFDEIDTKTGLSESFTITGCIKPFIVEGRQK